MDWWPSITVQVATSRSHIAAIVGHSFEYKAPKTPSKFGAVEFGLNKALDLILMSNNALDDHMIIIETDDKSVVKGLRDIRYNGMQNNDIRKKILKMANETEWTGIRYVSRTDAVALLR